MKSSVATNASSAKASFDALLESNGLWFEWIEGAENFETLLKDKVDWTALDANGTEFIQKRLKSKTPARQMLLNSFYLTMVSGFEEFLREKIREATRRYSKSKAKYDELAEHVRRIHMRESARLLRRIDSPPDYIALNIEELCRGIGSCIPGSDAVLLNPDAFSDIESLVLLHTFVERVNIFGYKLRLDALGDDVEVKRALQLRGTGARETTKMMQGELAAMRRNRNRIAHAGSDAAEVTTQLLTTHRMLLKAVAAAIDRVVC